MNDSADQEQASLKDAANALQSASLCAEKYARPNALADLAL